MKKTLFGILALIILSFSCMKAEMEAPPKPEPFAAPEFTLQDLKGKTVSLSDYKGNPLMINFWATWCLPCKREMPELEKLYKERKGEGLGLLMINMKESKGVVEEYIKEGGYTFRVLLDEKGAVSRAFRVFGLPTTFFVDSEGVVQYFYMGELTRNIIVMGLKSIAVIKPE